MSAMSRRLPRTPTQPPGTIIVIENVLPANATAAATTAEDVVKSPAAGERPSSPDSAFFESEFIEADPFLGFVDDVILCIFLMCTFK